MSSFWIEDFNDYDRARQMLERARDLSEEMGMNGLIESIAILHSDEVLP